LEAKKMKKMFGMMLLVIGMSSYAAAFGFDGFDWERHDVPEIDANSAVSAGVLLSGALLVIRGRRKQK
jgi:hypothetical protein